MSDDLRPEIALALGYAPPSLRVGFATLFRLDFRLGSLVSTAREPQLGLIRLAWWRDAIDSGADGRSAVADPLLADLLTMVRRRDVTPANIQRMISGWSALLEALPLDAEPLESYATGRGAGLVAAAAELSGHGPPETAGKCYALADFAMHCSDPTTRDRALAMAANLQSEPLPRALRPFALLDNWAGRDAIRVQRGAAPLSLRRRALAALTFPLTGPRL